jgi:hypothetical protein
VGGGARHGNLGRSGPDHSGQSESRMVSTKFRRT